MKNLKVALSVVYSNTTIEYLEDENKFRFELRGRERKADSLKQAKEWLDRPEPVKKTAKNFKPIQVVLANGGYSDNGYHKKHRTVVTVTSIPADRYRNEANNPSHAWVSHENNTRSKEGVHNLYLIHDTNAKRWEEYDSLVVEGERIEEQKKKVLKTLEAVDLKPYLLPEESV